MDTLTMLVALGMMVCVLVAKMLTTQLVARMKKSIEGVAHERHEALNLLKASQAQRQVAEKNKILADRKLKKLEAKSSRLAQELEGMNSSDRTPRQRDEAKRSQIVR